MEPENKLRLVKEFLNKAVRVVYHDGNKISYFTGTLNKLDGSFVYGTDKFDLTVAINVERIDKISELKKERGLFNEDGFFTDKLE